jgi:hypothetical protein
MEKRIEFVVFLSDFLDKSWQCDQPRTPLSKNTTIQPKKVLNLT